MIDYSFHQLCKCYYNLKIDNTNYEDIKETIKVLLIEYATKYENVRRKKNIKNQYKKEYRKG